MYLITYLCCTLTYLCCTLTVVTCWLPSSVFSYSLRLVSSYDKYHWIALSIMYGLDIVLSLSHFVVLLDAVQTFSLWFCIHCTFVWTTSLYLSIYMMLYNHFLSLCLVHWILFNNFHFAFTVQPFSLPLSVWIAVYATTKEALIQWIMCLDQQIKILDATVRQRLDFQDIVEAQDNLRLITLRTWAGLGAIQWVDQLHFCYLRDLSQLSMFTCSYKAY